MLKQPYEYQEDLIGETSRALYEHRAVILQSPPGSGKTIIMQNMIFRGLKKGNTFLVLTDALNIYSQLVNEFSAIEINSGVKSLYIREGFCYVAMAQTLKKRPVILAQFRKLGRKLVVMTDEAHIDLATPILLELDIAYQVGVTATPYYCIAPFLPKVYKYLVHGPQVEYLISIGKLCKVRHLARTRGNLSLLQMRNGEFTEQSQDEVFNAKNVYDGLFDDLRSMQFKKCIIFVASKKSADKLNEQLLERGFASTKYHSSVDNRKFELAKFTELNVANIMVTIKSLSKGWDYKPIDLVVLNHKTTSPAVYLQECGRGSRIIPGDKDEFTVFGLWG
jgi:superfamily II DNA or RNA helicase